MTKVSRKRSPTQADVARLAGVSRPMVSYVLNNLSSVQVAAETRRKILDAMETLGYRPDRAAQTLRTRRTRTIAVIIPDITNPFYPAFQRGVQDVAREFKHSVIAYNTDGDRAEEALALEWAQEGVVDGLIGQFFHIPIQSLKPVLERNIFVVHMGVEAAPDTELAVDRVYVDNAAMARTAVNYLIEKGHRRIAMISGEMDSPQGKIRVKGYHQAVAEHALPLDEALVRSGDFTEEGGYSAMQTLLAVPQRPSAVFAANDMMALGAMRAIYEAGLNVPRDIALMGIDDIPAASLVSPSLTTIDHFPQRQGQKAAQMLFERIDRRFIGGVRNQEMPFQLLVRDTA